MNEYQLKQLINSKEKLHEKITSYINERILVNQKIDEDEIKGHIEKSEHNLNFVKDTLKQNYTDWAITGCYYAVYQIALALILRKCYSSKNHDATLCILIKEYYKKGVSEEDIKLINKFFLDYQDLLFYVQSKNKREEASYSSYYKFDKKSVNNLRLKAVLFVNKAKEILSS